MTAALLILAAIALAAVACIAWERVSILLDRAYEQGHTDAMDQVQSARIQAGIDAGYHDGGRAA